MAANRKSKSSDGSVLKKKKAFFMEMKLDIIKSLENGEIPANIGRLLGKSRTTASTKIDTK